MTNQDAVYNMILTLAENKCNSFNLTRIYRDRLKFLCYSIIKSNTYIKVLFTRIINRIKVFVSIIMCVVTSGNIFTGTLNYMRADHYTHGGWGVFCTDTTIGTIGIIDEMLLYSNTGVIEALPALPDEWNEGSIKVLCKNKCRS